MTATQTKIRVQCQCAQTYQVSSTMIGKRVKCKKCDAVFSCTPIKSAAPAVPPKAPVEKTKVCESCSATMPLQNIICTACTYNHSTKKKMKKIRAADPRSIASTPARKQKQSGKSKRLAGSKSTSGRKEGGSFLGIDFGLMFSGLLQMFLGVVLLAVALILRGLFLTSISLICEGFMNFVRGLLPPAKGY